MLSFSTIQILLRQRRAGTRNRVLFVYACTMAVLTAIWYTVGAIWSEQDFLNFDPDDRNKFELLQCTPLGIAKDELAALMLIGSDALLVRSSLLLSASGPTTGAWFGCLVNRYTFLPSCYLTVTSHICGMGWLLAYSRHAMPYLRFYLW